MVCGQRNLRSYGRRVFTCSITLLPASRGARRQRWRRPRRSVWLHHNAQPHREEGKNHEKTNWLLGSVADLKQAMLVHLNSHCLCLLLAGGAVCGGVEGACSGSVWKKLDAQRDGTPPKDPEWHQQACGAAAEWALHQCASTDCPTTAQTSPVSSTSFHLSSSVFPFWGEINRESRW